ncbi:glycosyltransferase family 1 protein, partial [Candidatus Shapirobacteria bacterium CG10_big_fil_rev_8_21_14_0_10_48_15]
MRILIFNWRDIKHHHQGGAEVVTFEHAKAWVKAGHRVTW